MVQQQTPSASSEEQFSQVADVAGSPEGAIAEQPANTAGTAPSVEAGAAGGAPEKKPRTYSEDEFRTFQSKTDSQLNEIRRELDVERRRAEGLRQAALRNSVDAQAEVVTTQLAQRYANQYGMTLEQGKEIAQQQVDAYKELWLTQQATQMTQTQFESERGRILDESQRLVRHQIATKYQIPIEELANINDAPTMERIAKLTAETRKLAGKNAARAAAERPGQDFGGPAPSNVQTLGERQIIARYAAGDPSVSHKQYADARARLNGT